MLNETSVRPSEGRLIIPVLVFLGIGASQGKTPSKGHRYVIPDISIFGELGQVRKIRPNCSK